MLQHSSETPELFAGHCANAEALASVLSPGALRARNWLAIAAALMVMLSPQRAPATGGQRQSMNFESGTNPVKARPATPLALLVPETERNNARIISARRAWQAAAQTPSQASALPDPSFTVQQFAVGSPRPFAGFSNSNFAYIGFGISQQLPYPGKLRLRGDIASRGATIAGDQFDRVRRDVVEQLKGAYFQLSSFQKTLEILRRDQQLLAAVEKIAETRYRAGPGNQQDVLKAQLQETKLLRDLALYDERKESTEARLKELLNRAPDSADIAAEEMTQTPFAYTFDQLRSRVAQENPEVRAQQDAVSRRALAVELAKKDFYPDFSVGYMWQHTGPEFRDYYMLTLGVQVPIHWRRKQEPALAEAVENLDASRRSYEARTQQALFAIRDQYLEAGTSARVLTIYRQGLIPQATATFKAGLAAYETGREDFQTLLGSFEDVLNLEIEYWQTLAQHETALAQLERLTGVSMQ
ncbi:MAG: TolC family protein [Terriglobia bacterium]